MRFNQYAVETSDRTLRIAVEWMLEGAHLMSLGQLETGRVPIMPQFPNQVRFTTNCAPFVSALRLYLSNYGLDVNPVCQCGRMFTPANGEYTFCEQCKADQLSQAETFYNVQ